MSNHRYSYFYWINGVKYIIKIDKSFSDISDLEDISRYSHEQRRAFAEHIIFKFGVSSPCILDASDFINPFATQVARLFNGHMTCIFIVGERETTLCLSGSLKYIHFDNQWDWVYHCEYALFKIQIVNIAGILKYYGFFKIHLNPILA